MRLCICCLRFTRWQLRRRDERKVGRAKTSLNPQPWSGIPEHIWLETKRMDKNIRVSCRSLLPSTVWSTPWPSSQKNWRRTQGKREWAAAWRLPHSEWARRYVIMCESYKSTCSNLLSIKSITTALLWSSKSGQKYFLYLIDH